jgi:hypothetical protein
MVSAYTLYPQRFRRVHELTDKLVDEDIRDGEWSELCSLLTNSDEGRVSYIEAMLLHAGLRIWAKRTREEQST